MRQLAWSTPQKLKNFTTKDELKLMQYDHFPLDFLLIFDQSKTGFETPVGPLTFVLDRKLASGYDAMSQLYATEIQGWFDFHGWWYDHAWIEHDREFSYLSPSLDDFLLQQPALMGY